VLCVSIQRPSASVRHGQTADFTVRVWTENGSADAVTVTLATSPAGDDAAFSGLCPGGDGTSSCAVGDLATPVTPTSFVLTAQTAVLLNAGEVTLTVTADAVTSPAMTAEPQAAATVSVAPAISTCVQRSFYRFVPMMSSDVPARIGRTGCASSGLGWRGVARSG
jgi:hypothetical protein